MNIRESNFEDLDSIYQVHLNAFGEAEGKLVAQLACDILLDEPANRWLSLVAEDHGKVMASVLFSAVKIVANVKCSAYILLLYPSAQMLLSHISFPESSSHSPRIYHQTMV